jgi:hypothetical protein
MLHFDTRSFSSVICACVFIFIVGSVSVYRNSLSKNSLMSTSGKIIFLDKNYQEWPIRNFDKYRYIKIDNYRMPFEISIGKEWDDFKPKFEAIDKLSVGDQITIYYVKNESSKGINQSVKFIDKDGKSYFERGSSGKMTGVFIILSSVIIAIASYYGYRKGHLTG